MAKQKVHIQLETKTFAFQVKSIDEAQGIIRGYLAVFNNVDSANDRIRPGAFKKTIAEALQRKDKRGKKFLWPLLWMHDPEKPIGGFIDATEDKTGLLVTAQLDISTNEQGIPLNPLAMSIFSGFKMGYIDELSIGYKAIQKSYEPGTGVRDLAEIQNFEGSAVTMNFAANELAQVTDVKSTSAHKGKTMPQLQYKDFNDRYREEQIRDWKSTDFQNLVIALQAAIMDIFAIGDSPQIDVLDTILNGIDNGSDDPGNKIGFIDAVRDYVQKGIDLDVSNYMSDNSGFGYVSSYGYMTRGGKLEGKAGAVVSQANADRLKGHIDTMMQVKDMVASVADDMQRYITGSPPFVDDNGDADETAPNKDTSKNFEPRNALKTQPLTSSTGDDALAQFEAWLQNQLQTRNAA